MTRNDHGEGTVGGLDTKDQGADLARRLPPGREAPQAKASLGFIPLESPLLLKTF